MLNKISPTQLRPDVQKWLRQSQKVLLGKDEALCRAFICVLTRGHLLIEDVPGVGKTTLVKLISRIFHLNVSRIQFTNDLLASDIIGINIFDRNNHSFEFKSGPLFGELILADELNRANPKTQSALLQAMEERKVHLDGEEHILSPEFIVMATQNPNQQIGTYLLPESQLDRFFMSTEIGFPAREYEKVILHREKSLESYDEIEQMVSINELQQMRAEVKAVHLAEVLSDYILDLLKYGREQEGQKHSLSMRAGKDLVLATQAHAWLHGRDYATALDVQMVLPYIWGHRLGGMKGIRYGQQIVQKLVEDTPLAI